MANLARRVANRFYWLVLSDDRYRPPKWLVNAVDEGTIPSKGLLLWKYVVEKMAGKFQYGGAVVYWRHKCAKEGIQLPSEYLKGGGGEGAFGPWKIKTGDQIEDWVRARLKNEGLISDTIRTVAEWEIEITHIQRMVDDAQERIAKHVAGIAEGKRVKQREGWLAEARSDLEKASKEMEKAKEAVQKLSDTAQRHETAQAPAVDFENAFWTALQEATKDLGKRQILAQAKAALAKFEAELEGGAMAKEAGVLDSLWRGLVRAWDFVVGAFETIKDWVAGLSLSTKKLDRMLDQAGAKA